jgi:hypothetical protein
MARTAKVSVALDKDALAKAKKLAAAEGLSLSALLMRLLVAHFERQARFESMDRFIDEYVDHGRVSEQVIQSIRDQLSAPLRPVRRGRRRRAA